ncbi:MAG: FxSxx-COOH system tetratricopeptide repeat protein [Actinomycetota bacterium]
MSHTSELNGFPPNRSFVDVVMSALASLPDVTAVEQNESFFAEPHAPNEMCERRVTECDIYVGVIGWRFGSTVEGDETGRSFVEYEFDLAGELGKPRLLFVWDPDDVPKEFVTETGFGDQVAFRQRLASTQEIVFRPFTVPAELSAEVKRAVGQVTGAAVASAEFEPIWCTRVPRRPTVFAVRDDIFAELRAIDVREDGSPTQVVWSVAGQGGVGKTTLAAAYAEESRGEFDVIWWVRAEDPSTLRGDLVELAERLSVGGPSDQDAAIARLIEWLETTQQSWLLVFDNATTSESVRDLLPKRGNGTALLTTRNQALSELGRLVPIDTWTLETAAGFLNDRVAATNPEAALDPAIPAVAERLGGLALAVEQAGAWVATSPLRTFSRYLELLEENIEAALGVDTVPPDYPTPAWAAWRMSLEAAAAVTPLAQRVFELAAHLAPEPIPVLWLDADDPYLDSTPEALEEALTTLYEHSLIRLDRSTLTVHRLPAEAARSTADTAALSAAIQALRAQCSGNAWEHELWPSLAHVASHASTVAGCAKVHGERVDESTTTALWYVLYDVATYYRASGQLDAALDSGHRAHAIAVDRLGPDDPSTLTTRHQLATTHLEAGNHTQALTQFTELLNDRVRILGPDHPHTLTARHQLATTHLQAGNHTQALTLFTELLDDQLRILGPDHPNNLTARHQLATTHLQAGNRSKALIELTEVLDDRVRILGPEHPDTLTTRNVVATTHLRAGNHTQALTQFTELLNDQLRILGPDHPNTLTTRHQLASTDLRAGNHTQALALFTELLDDRLRILGPDHPSTIATRRQLDAAKAAVES